MKTSTSINKLLLFLPLLLAGLAGCTRIPLDSLWALRQFDLQTFEPGQLRLAVRLPPGLALQSQQLALTTRVAQGGDAGVEQRFVLSETRDAADAAGLPAADPRRARWVVLKFDAAEAARIRAFRQELLALKAQQRQSGAGNNSLHLGVAPRLCRTGAPVKADDTLAAALHWSSEKGFVMLLRESDAASLLQELEQPRPLAQLESC